MTVPSADLYGLCVLFINPMRGGSNDEAQRVELPIVPPGLCGALLDFHVYRLHVRSMLTKRLHNRLKRMCLIAGT